MSNVIELGKKPKAPPPPPPTHGDMTGYTVSRAISKHFGIAITNEDAIKLDRELRAMVFHSMQQARAEERQACVDMVLNYMDETENMEARGCLASVAHDIQARGNL